MSELLAQSSPSSPPPDPHEGPPAVPPVIDPGAWEDFPVFRETFLYYLTPRAYAAAVRGVGEWLFGMVLECYGQWPAWPESATRTEVRAALADLRHLEGFLTSVGREHEVSSLADDDTRLSQLAARLAPELGALAAEIERALAPGEER